MTKKIGVMMSLAVLFFAGFLSIPSEAAVPLDKLKVDLGLQYRVMYNFSNITTSDDYDFFRQRFRVTLDVKPGENVGGSAQFEYRGGWGGTSPGSSDPRGASVTSIPFNRLQARGIRYGYVYFTHDSHLIKAGILPVSDQMGDTIFSADWDFNVGGAVLIGKAEPLDYRVAYVRLVDSLLDDDPSDSDWDFGHDQNGHLGILDINTSIDNVKLGGYVYYLSIDGEAVDTDDDGLGDTPKNTQGWYGVTAATKVGEIDLNGFVLFNSGEIGDESNDGIGVKVEGSLPLGDLKLSAMFLMTTGDETPAKGFQTIQGLLGSGGYWAYTYIFTPHGPSDVNDFGLEIGNAGYGLRTIQVKLDIPVSDRLDAQVQAGWFQSSEDVGASGDGLGTEFGGQVKYGVAKNLNLEAGAAFASLDDAAITLYQVADEKSVKEVFARFQLEF